MSTERIDQRIGRFLEANPLGSLLVAVGYATPAGLAWLHQRTESRAVSVLIGDAHRVYWRNVTVSDRVAARQFLLRSNVEVHNWYRTSRSKEGASEAHLKIWLVYNRNRVSAALVGSANLTNKGLHNNTEIMVEPVIKDLRNVWATAHELWRKSWDAKERLLGYLNDDVKQSDDTEEALRTLGLRKGTTTDEIRSAHRLLILRLHPDKATESEREVATLRSAKINAAYNHLIDIK